MEEKLKEFDKLFTKTDYNDGMPYKYIYGSYEEITKWLAENFVPVEAIVRQGVPQPVQTAGLHIGDIVRVSSTAECYSDWKDLEAEVVGIIKRPNGDLDYTIKDGDCEYDGFEDADLIKVS